MRSAAVLTLLLVLGLPLAGCSPRQAPTPPDPAPAETPPARDEGEEARTDEAPRRTEEAGRTPAEERTPEPPRTEEKPPPETRPDYLYHRTEEDLRVAFTDALYSLDRRTVAPGAPTRLTAREIRAWLADLDAVAPRLAARTREVLGPVLDQRYTVGFLLPDANTAGCARFNDILYVAVPERYQQKGRAFDGFLVRDECIGEANELCLLCTGGRGKTDQGTLCSCTCSLSECPGTECVKC